MSCIIGQETTRFSVELEDNDSAVTSVDWIINDTELDGTDNTDRYSNKESSFKPEKQFHSTGSKEIKAVVHFDDGWGNEYTHTVQVVKEVSSYDTPIVGLEWDPSNPTITDEVTVTPRYNDLRDDTVPSTYGLIDTISIDYYNDGNVEEVNKEKTGTYHYTFETRADQIEIKITAKYWDGFEYKTTDKVEVLTMSNMPPVSDYTVESTKACIPTYLWTATSTDPDGPVEDLSYAWTLYKNSEDDGTGNWEEVDNGAEAAYKYPFQYTGRYKIKLVTIDKYGLTDTKEEELDVVFDTCGGNGEPAQITISSGQTTYFDWE